MKFNSLYLFLIFDNIFSTKTSSSFFFVVFPEIFDKSSTSELSKYTCTFRINMNHINVNSDENYLLLIKLINIRSAVIVVIKNILFILKFDQNYNFIYTRLDIFI